MMTATSRRNKLMLLGLLVLLFVLAGSCNLVWIENDQNTWDPHGPIADEIDAMFFEVFWITVVIFILVQGALIYILFRFRERRGTKLLPKQMHGNTALEITWTIIPALILAYIAVPTVQGIFDFTKCESGSMPIEITAHQWWFEFHYPDHGIETANVMTIPVDTPICLEMDSEDVIHSFWVPELQGKRYITPGQPSIMPIEASDLGEYWAQCGEFCGLSHSLMRGRVIVLSNSDFDRWVSEQQQVAVEPEPDTLAAEGLSLFAAKGCTACHGVDYGPDSEHTVKIDRASFNGPDLTHFSSRHVFAGAYLPADGKTTTESLQEWLANPPALKPGSYMPNLGLTETEIDAIIEWLETLQ